MSQQEYKQEVMALPAFSDLDESLRETVADIMLNVSVARSIGKGTTWLKRGEESENNGYVLLEGEVSIEKAGAPIGTQKAPELLGEGMQYNPSRKRTATITTLSECAVLRFSWDEFWKAVDESLADDARAKVHAAIENYAWSHFAG